MKAVILMFDSLNRQLLSPYGCDWTHTPNFQRLAERTVTFDTSYVCSMPCMPARRDFHTGRPNFLHRSWGPIEPYDDSVPEMLKEAGVHTHLATDHYHYFEEGGCNYHTRYSTWEFFRGQEGDPWFGQVGEPDRPAEALGQNAKVDRWHDQDWKNRAQIKSEADMPQRRTVQAGLDFMRRNQQEDNWMVQIETFDPHEPFFSTEECKRAFAEHYQNYDGPFFDWPVYGPVRESEEAVAHLRHEYASLLAACDRRVGEVLDAMDELDLWKDTMLIVWTDHGFLLGEKDLLGKIQMPFYEEIARTPFFVWDPRSGQRGERRKALVQPSIDLGPTLLDWFGLEPTEDMLGRNLRRTIESDQPVREYGLFGCFGRHVNVTDGRHVYMRGPVEMEDQPLFEYTLMPTHMRHTFSVEELAEKTALEEGGFAFAKRCSLLRIAAKPRPPGGERFKLMDETMLFDLEKDPQQREPVSDKEAEARMAGAMKRLMRECEAPPEQYERLGL